METKRLQAYELMQEQELKGIQSKGYLLRHKKSGARIVLIENEDENKVFSVGFRTPPQDSTGLPHILEHSVLCGSREFPAKDPFVELGQRNAPASYFPFLPDSVLHIYQLLSSAPVKRI